MLTLNVNFYMISVAIEYDDATFIYSVMAKQLYIQVSLEACIQTQSLLTLYYIVRIIFISN